MGGEKEFDVTKRLGCIGCPLQSRRKRIEDFKQNPKMFKLWLKHANIYYRNYTGEKKHFKDAFEAMGYQLYCDNMIQFEEKTHGMFGDFDWKEFLEKEFNVDLSDI